MSEINRPPFIYRGGGMMMHPPFKQKDSLLFGFFLKGDADKLQALCDRYLNAVAGEQYLFEPLSQYVMLTLTRINKDYSLHPADRAKGWGKEIDASFWVPVGRYIIRNNQKVLDKIHWFSPYIWVDHPMTILNGRDIFGYPKYLGRFEMPESPASADLFAMDVNAFKTHSPESEAAYSRLFEVQRKPVTGLAGAVEEWDEFTDFAQALYQGMSNLESDLIHPDSSLMLQLLSGLKQPHLPQLFLKQFPDGNGENAVYQALMTSPAMIKKFRCAGLLLGDYEFTLQSIASVPIAEDLGIAVGTHDVALGFYVDFDFTIEPPQELVNNSNAIKQKIAVLGGGVGAMTAAFALTSTPDWQSKYEVTLYQMGWRVGGKGASGRNAELGQRIEEHGLHIWFGFYENAFKVMQEAYEELARPLGAPLRTWDEAFKPHSFVVLQEYIKEQWKTWPLEFPIKAGVPGQGKEMVTLGQIAQTLYAWVKQAMEDLFEQVTGIDIERNAAIQEFGLGVLIQRWIDRVGEPLFNLVENGIGLISLVDQWLDVPDKVLAQEDQSEFAESLLRVKRWLDNLVDDLLEDNDEIRRLFILIDLGVTALRGMHTDQLFDKGFDSINHLDFRDWLQRHGANEKYTVQSAPVRAVYDLVFAYEQGDIHRPSFEAGTCLRGALRMVFSYKGGVMWKMQAGMGDVVFTPLYQVLKQRGVKFKFFHKVEELVPDPNDSERVGAIRMIRQVDLVDGENHYYPFVHVGGLACWPNQPLYPQIVPEQAALLREHAINLESSWTEWPNLYQKTFGKSLPQVTLEYGKDFHKIIFGLSLGSVPEVCAELVKRSPPLKACVDNVKTVVTQAYQLWMRPNLQQTGWKYFPETKEEPVLTAFTEPLDTWASMNQLLCREQWPKDLEPLNASYFCGVQLIRHFPSFSEVEFPERCKQAVKENAIEQLNQHIQALWPNAKTRDGEFKWYWLVDTENRQGVARFDSQYWRSNIDPSERYVQSVVNSTKYRIATQGTGFTNLYVTGDWIKTSMNAGCVEAAVQAGLQTARAISGFPEYIKGESDFG